MNKRPTKYTPGLGQQICNFIAGSSDGLVKICLYNGFPHHTTIFRWLRDPDKKDFLVAYQRAREAQADLLSDEIIEIADEMGRDNDGAAHVSRARLRIDARKWKAARLSPKKYGEKGDVSGSPADTEEAVGNVIVWGDKEIRV